MTSAAHGARFVDVIGADGQIDGAVVIRADAQDALCPCGDEACAPDRYLSDRRSSEALAEHHA